MLISKVKHINFPKSNSKFTVDRNIYFKTVIDAIVFGLNSHYKTFEMGKIDLLRLNAYVYELFPKCKNESDLLAELCAHLKVNLFLLTDDSTIHFFNSNYNPEYKFLIVAKVSNIYYSVQNVEFQTIFDYSDVQFIFFKGGKIHKYNRLIDQTQLHRKCTELGIEFRYSSIDGKRMKYKNKIFLFEQMCFKLRNLKTEDLEKLFSKQVNIKKHEENEENDDDHY